MSEEYSSLVQKSLDFESGKKRLNSFGSMAYTENQDGVAPVETPTSVLAHDTSLNAMESGDSGELIETPEELTMLGQFHEDAIRQAGCGYSQVQILLATILAVCGASVEYCVGPFIVTSASIEFCIEDEKKSWLGLITPVGACVGAVFWGVLAGHVGKKRTLTSCLAVHAVFSLIGAVMPTYGIFIMARFCSAIGAGGVLPSALSLCREQTPLVWRSRVSALVLSGLGFGYLYAACLAMALLPKTGLEAFIENKEHLSAWHRYLLICTLPTLASLVTLIWAHESPKYLLENGREVDALVVYQEIHTSNSKWRCFGKYNPEEHQLDLPPTKPSQSTSHSFRSIFDPLRQTLQVKTAKYCATLSLVIFVQLLVVNQSPEYVQKQHQSRYLEQHTVISNQSFVGEIFNNTIENTEYNNVTFTDSVFRDTFLSQVEFVNCSFHNVTFSKVMTSHATFTHCVFVNSSLVDTSIVSVRDTVSCIWSGVVVAGVPPSCPRRLDLRSSLGPNYVGALAAAGGGLFAAAIATLAPRPKFGYTILTLLVLCIMCTPGIFLSESETGIFITAAMFVFLPTLVHYVIVLGVYDGYPTNVSCAVHGAMLALGALLFACFSRIAVTPGAVALLSAATLGLAAAASLGL